ncbi:MAG: BatA domain-containing protein [Thermoplasmata archaeon]
MRSDLRLLLALVLSFAVSVGVLSPAAAQDYPTFTPGDFWEYAVDVRLDTLLGFGNVSGSLRATGETRAEVSAVSQIEATVSWTGNLDLQGRFTLPGETTEAAISGTIETTFKEQRQAPYFLPVAFDAQAVVDGAITFLVTVPLGATLVVNATVPPTAESPTYPLAEGTQTFTTSGTLATNLSVDVLGMGFQNATVGEVPSTIRWNVTSFAMVEVPAGVFSGLRVTMEALTGFLPSPFYALIPGATQVTHHSASVGSPVLYQFLANGTEVGRASLETYASSVPPPFWLNPLFLGGLLAVPIALLLFRYVRERRRGL